ncbi:MAG: hypothetical protein JXB07_08260 [Anaerolineae bacterium]|nr:hypothetical protein [Anaerolineae bacterium]
MEKRLANTIGIILVFCGAVALIYNPMLPIIRMRGGLYIAGTAVSIVGLTLGLLPFMAPKKRGLGALFIPAIPILTTGGILFATAVFGRWTSWGALWPLEVLAVALGFALAGIYLRSVWLGIPAILIGVNGLVLAFCNITGEWEAWSVLWSAEPLAVGLAFLLIAARQHSKVLAFIGLAFCGFAWMAFEGMIALTLYDAQLFRIGGAATLIGMGVVLLGLNVFRGGEPAQPAATSKGV